MKKTINLMMIAAFAITFSFTSCSKDETTAVVAGPTVSLTDSTGTGIVDTTNFYTSSWMKLSVSPSSGTTIESIKTDIKVNGVVTIPGTFDPVDAIQKTGFSESAPVDVIVSQMMIDFGKTITFVVTVKDNKGQTKSAELTYNVKVDHTILASTEIELGAQSNATIPYKFLGTANSFAAYTPGANGTAKDNSSNIDFVYYYGTNDKNAFAAPSNLDGAKVIWNAEINMWAKQNRTKFKVSTITATEFDNIKNSTKVDDSFESIDFTTGTTDKITTLGAGNVFAFQTAAGIKGLVKFTTVSPDANGYTKLMIVCQN